MKVGIFGDSFAEPDWDESLSHGWAWYVSTSLPKAHINNYALGGSSIYFTYCEFLQEHHKHDRVIVFGSDAGRLYLPDTPTHWQINHVSGPNHFNEVNKQSVPKELREAINLYYKHILNYDEQDKMRELMIDNMQKLRPDMLYFDCFDYSQEISPQFSNHLSMQEISSNEKSEPYIDLRQNHMNAENNRIFGAKVTNWINTSQFEMNITEFTKGD